MAHPRPIRRSRGIRGSRDEHSIATRPVVAFALTGPGFTLFSRGIERTTRVHGRSISAAGTAHRPPIGLLAGLDAESDVTVTHTTAEPSGGDHRPPWLPEAMMPPLPPIELPVGARDREPEGRRRQDDDGGEPRRGARRARVPGPGRRPRSPGQRDDRTRDQPPECRGLGLRRRHERRSGRGLRRADERPEPLRHPGHDRPRRRRDRARPRDVA